MNLTHYLETCRKAVENDLEAFLSRQPAVSSHLDEAVRYSLFAGGKRVRPALAFAAAEAVGGKQDQAIPVASALEMIHTYSLIHDDLPAMDDDDLRRGRPTNHKVFGDATAILAGDSLLTEAFHRLGDPAWKIPAEARIEIVRCVADAAGGNGMVAGQTLDLEWEGKDVDPETLEKIHRHKTGRLLHASVIAGAMAGGANADALTAIDTYGASIGLAFQIADDLLDVTSTAEELGKATQKDEGRQKATYPSLFGLEESKQRAAKLLDDALMALKPFQEHGEPLRDIARYIVERRQ